MKNKILSMIWALPILSVVLMSGCITEDVTCNKPYIKVGKECCLDQNDNNICDKDETSSEKHETLNEDKDNEVPGEQDSDYVVNTQSESRENCPFECCVDDSDYPAKSCSRNYDCVNHKCVKQSCPFECCPEDEYSKKSCSSGYECQNNKCVYGYTKISDLLSNPRQYDSKTVTIKGSAFTQNLRPEVCIPIEGIPMCVGFDFSLLKVSDGSSLCVAYFDNKRYEGTVVVEGKLRSADAVYGNVKDTLFSQKTDVRTVITVKPTNIYQDGLIAKADVKVTVYDWIKGADISKKIGEKTQTVIITDNIQIGDVRVYIAGVDAVVTDSISVSVWKGSTALMGDPLLINEGKSREFEEVTLRDILDFADEVTFDLKGELRKMGGDVCAGDYVFIASKIEGVGG